MLVIIYSPIIRGRHTVVIFFQVSGALYPFEIVGGVFLERGNGLKMFRTYKVLAYLPSVKIDVLEERIYGVAKDQVVRSRI